MIRQTRTAFGGDGSNYRAPHNSFDVAVMSEEHIPLKWLVEEQNDPSIGYELCLGNHDGSHYLPDQIKIYASSTAVRTFG
jgi:hypothetical protein